MPSTATVTVRPCAIFDGKDITTGDDSILDEQPAAENIAVLIGIAASPSQAELASRRLSRLCGTFHDVTSS